ncbi:hypothetical protein [Helicobacter pametensis]|uniref:hypothetical protein n=1 Tax=Helicobacter pametensis TaxID=95149 RepID=UPI0004818909|nr:hypothetical protein [Helicobacter pametensis]
MIIKYKSTLEFYKIFFHSNEKDQLLPYFQVSKEEVWRAFADTLHDGNREKKIRGKKHKMWIDNIDSAYFYGFASRENHNGAMIEKETLEITLAQDENSRQELASLSHFVIDLKDNVLALEHFDGSMSKHGFLEYCSSNFKDLGFTMDIRPIPRNDLGEVLNDVTRLLSFSAKYNDIARINPNFIKENIKSKDERIEKAIKNPKYQARVRIDFTKEGLEINRNDTIIKRVAKKIVGNKHNAIDQAEEIEEDGWLDGKIEIRTMAGNDEIISLQENLFVTKMDFETEESMNRREFSEKSYKKILEKMQEMRAKNL